MRNIYISRNDRRYGPYSVDDVKYLAREGRLKLDDWIWLPGKNNWIKISSVESIASIIIKSKQIESEDYYLHRGGFKIGPFTKDMVISQLKSGELAPEDIIEYNGKLKNLKEIFPDLIASVLPETKEVVEITQTEEKVEVKQEPRKEKVSAYESEDISSETLFKKEDEIREFKYRKYIEEIDEEGAYTKSLLATTFVYAVLLLSAFYIRAPEPQMNTEILVPERVAQLLPDSPINISTTKIEEMGRDKGEGPGKGGTGTSTGGGSSVGLGPGATGVLGLITKVGPGGTVADLLGEGSGDIDSILKGLGGLKTSGLSSSGTGGGFGLGGGLGLGGGIANIDDLISGMGGGGGGDSVKLKKEGVVKITGPSGITGAGSTSGQRTSAIIRSVVESHRSGIEYTYKKYLKSNPILQGKLVLQFVIAAAGNVTKVQIISSTLGAPSLDQDIVNLIYNWRFPPIPEGEVTVLYPFVFFTSQK